MAFLNVIAEVNPPGGLWQWLIRDVFGSFIPNFGLCVVVFTVSLRLFLFPLDFLQRKMGASNKKKTELMEPYMEKIRRQYEGDKMAILAKQRELQKKFKYSVLPSCLPMIVSLVIFITMFSGMRSLVEYGAYRSYDAPRAAYEAAYKSADYEDVKGRYLRFFTDFEKNYPGKDKPAEPVDFDSDATAAHFAKFTAADAVNSLIFSRADYSANDTKTYGTDFYHAFLLYNIKNAEPLSGRWYDVTDGKHNEDKAEGENTVPLAEARVFDALLKQIGQDAARDAYGGKFAKTEYKVSDERTDGDFNAPQNFNFLWIKNLMVPDAAWTLINCSRFSVVKPVPEYDVFNNLLNDGQRKGLGWKDEKGTDLKTGASEYGIVMAAALSGSPGGGAPSSNAGVNGYYILTLFVVGLTILSTKINAAGNPMPVPDGGAAGGAPGMNSMKMMLWLMPAMMGFFAITYNAAFSLYMAVNSASAIGSTFLCNRLIKFLDKRKLASGGGKGGADAKKPVVAFQRYVKK